LNKKLEEKYGMHFDVTTNSEIVPGRPTPFMVYDCMLKTKTINIESVVKIDDTAVGMMCGNNAGCWTIGLYASGSNNYDMLEVAKPDFLVPSVAYVPDIIFGQIEPRLKRGERPGQGILEVI
jgi:phosphonoacetaldehyde hydrolase